MNRDAIVREFAKIINIHCLENESGTPDFILAEYLVACLEAFNTNVNARKKWYAKQI